MFTHFDDAARLAMRLAELEARRLGRAQIATEHLLLALARLHDCAAARVLARAGIRLDDVCQEVERRVRGGAEEGDRLELTAGAGEVIDLATAAADRLGHARVGTGHLLLGLLEEARGVAYVVLVQAGIGRLGGNLSRVSEHVIAEMASGRNDRLPRRRRRAAARPQPAPWIFPKAPAPARAPREAAPVPVPSTRRRARKAALAVYVGLAVLTIALGVIACLFK